VALTEKHHKHKVTMWGRPWCWTANAACCFPVASFCREIAGVDELGIFSHGGNSELMNAPGKKLENEYTGNVVDLCPVVR